MTEPTTNDQRPITSSLEFGADVYNALRGDFPLVGRDEKPTASIGFEFVAMIRRAVRGRMPRQQFLDIANLLYCEQAMVEAEGNMCKAGQLIATHRNTMYRILGPGACIKPRKKKQQRSSR